MAWPVRRTQAAALAPQQRLTGNRDGDSRAIIHLQRADKAGRRHADDSERLLVEFECLADDCRVGGEPFLPELMAEHDHWRGARLVIFVTDCAPQNGLYAQPGVIATRYGLSVDDLRLLAYHGAHFRNRREGKEIAERATRRGDLRLAHPDKDVVAKQRKRLYVRRLRYIRSTGHAATHPER